MKILSFICSTNTKNELECLAIIDIDGYIGSIIGDEYLREILIERGFVDVSK